jgi:hypothetical protein
MKKLADFKKNLFFFGAAALLLAVAGPLPVLHAAPAGKLVIEPSSFDCGVVEEGASAVMLATIVNDGGDEAVIQNVRTN